MFNYLNSLSWARLSIILALLFTLVLLIGGQIFVGFGFAHDDVSALDAFWPPFVVRVLVYVGCSLMPVLLPTEEKKIGGWK